MVLRISGKMILEYQNYLPKIHLQLVDHLQMLWSRLKPNYPIVEEDQILERSKLGMSSLVLRKLAAPTRYAGPLYSNMPLIDISSFKTGVKTSL